MELNKILLNNLELMEKNIEIFDILMLFCEMDFIIFYKFFND